MWILWGDKNLKSSCQLRLAIQLCPALCDLINWSPPGSSVHGILQARILEWIAMPSSRGSSQPRDWTRVSHIVGRFFTIWATREALSCQLEAIIMKCRARNWLSGGEGWEKRASYSYEKFPVMMLTFYCALEWKDKKCIKKLECKKSQNEQCL